MNEEMRKKEERLKRIVKLSRTRQSELATMVLTLEAKVDWLIDQLLDRAACSENFRDDDGDVCTKMSDCKKCWQEMTEWAVGHALP